MKTMPKSFERKIRKLNRLILESHELDREIQEHLDQVGVPYDNLVANVAPYGREHPVTEALAYINNAECKSDDSLNDSIDSIKKVYEHFVNL